MPQDVLRIGSVPYLNARVLIHCLAGQEGVSLELQPPSILARKLATDALDVALVSSIEYFRHPEYRAVPGLSVSGRREMWSIRLFHRVPLTEIRSIRLDPASETTNALVRILLKERFGLEPEYRREESRGRCQEEGARSEERGGGTEEPRSSEGRGQRAEVSDRSHKPQAASLKPIEPDAFLLIGDPALTFNQAGWPSMDLLSIWHELTGLPFVFAFWQARPGVDVEALGARLRRCRDEGLKHAAAIAASDATPKGMSRDRALTFISSIVRYDFGEEERAGLRRFQEYLLKHRLLDTARPDL